MTEGSVCGAQENTCILHFHQRIIQASTIRETDSVGSCLMANQVIM